MVMLPECLHTRALLDSYLSGELLIETNHQLLNHLSACSACSAELAQRRRVRTLLKSALSTDDPPAWLSDRVRQETVGSLAVAQPSRSVHRRPSTRPRHVAGSPSRMTRFILTTAALALSAVVGLLWWSPWAPVSLDASELLEKSGEATRTLESQPGVVLHRSLRYEKRQGRGGPVVATMRVEVWRNNADGVTVRRAFSDGDMLVAGEWHGREGEHTVYRAGVAPQRGVRSLDVARLDSGAVDDAAWRMDLSASTYAHLVPASSRLRALELPEHIVLHYRAAPADPDPLVEASLTLVRKTLRPIEQRVVLQREGKVEEYALTEVQYRALRIEDVAAGVFLPDTALLGAATPPPAELPTAVNRGPAPVKSGVVPLTVEEELDLAHRLHRLDAWVRDSLYMTHSATGALVVSARVADERRRDDILAALSASGYHDLIADITIGRHESGGEASAPPLARRVPIHEVLRTHFADFLDSRLTGDDVPVDRREHLVEELLRSCVTRNLERADAALAHAGALDRLVEQFTGRAALPADAQARFHTMLRDFARGIARPLGELRLELQPIVDPDAPRETGEVDAMTEPVLLGPSAERLHVLVEEVHGIVSSALRHETGRPSTDLRRSDLWRAISEAEQLAEALRGPLQVQESQK